MSTAVETLPIPSAPIGAQRVRSPSGLLQVGEGKHIAGGSNLAPDVIAGAELIGELMSDNAWHLRVDIQNLMLELGVLGSVFGITDYLYLAESDSGRWWCIPGPSTPDLAPDNT